MKRVAITGVGVICAVGNNSADVFSSLMAGRSGVRRINVDADDRLTVRIGAGVAFNPLDHFTQPKLMALDRFSQFGLVVAEEAVRDAGLRLHDMDRTRIGVSFGTGVGGVATIEDGYLDLFRRDAANVNPMTVLRAMNNAAAAQIALEHGLEGPNLTFSTACSSSAIAIGEAFRLIRYGQAETMVAGGSEALLTFGSMKAWDALRVLALEDTSDAGASCRPFSRDRSGMVLGEGAAAVVLEEWDGAVTRGARIYGELVGYGLSNDACHITRPSVTGQARTMALALEDANLVPGDIGYVNAHGTGTAVGDKVETAAIKQIFGEHAYRIPVSSTKSMHGHAMGAAGAIEFVVAVLAMVQGAVPPTANLRIRDPDCDLDYVPGIGRTGLDIGAVMSSSFAFGGANAVLIVARR